mmetsp:Transcript_4747/g.19352  ORF Transcript_4747/g.19352 Transcript_4747/m.19352 type:complete len:352 (-) Transcript_4747:7-1062(-)
MCDDLLLSRPSTTIDNTSARVDRRRCRAETELCARASYLGLGLLGLRVLGEEVGEGGLVVGMPARQRRAVLDDVAHGPLHAEVVDVARRFGVGADDVEAAPVELGEHEVDDLLGHPRPRRGLGLVEEHARRVERLALLAGLLALRLEHDRGVDPSRDEERRAHRVGARRAELVLEALGVRLEGGLADVVRQVARRHGDALLGARVDDEPLLAARPHARHEGQTAVDGAERVDAQRRAIPRRRREGAAAAADAGVVDQHVARARFGEDALGERLDRRVVGHVDDDGRRPRQLRRGGPHLGLVDVDEVGPHADGGELPRHRATDATRRARHDGHLAGANDVAHRDGHAGCCTP